MILFSYDAHEKHQLPAGHYNPKGEVVAHIPWRQPTALSLTLRPAQQKENHSWYWKPSELSTSEVMVSGEESTPTNLLNQHNP